MMESLHFGKINSWYGLRFDTHDKKLAEEALHESGERLQKAMQIETVGVLFFNDAGKFYRCQRCIPENDRLYREHFSTHTVTTEDITVAEWLPRTKQAMEEIKIKGMTTPNEKELTRPDGSHWWGLFAGARIKENENVEYVVDVTKRREADDALWQNEKRIRTLSNAVPQGIWTNDKKGKANFFNQRWYEYSGLSYGHSVGKGWEAIVHPDDAPASKNKWQQPLAAGEIFDTEY